MGEGSLAGVPARLIRFAGCSVSQCPLHPYRGGGCDTDWQYRETQDVERIADEAKASRCHWAMITGGEPADQSAELYQLIAALHERNMRVCVQTSGTKPVNVDVIDWLVVSPKAGHADLTVRHGHELKVVHGVHVFDYGSLRAWHCLTNFIHYWLQPLWKQDGTCNAADCAEMVLGAAELGAGPWKLSLQQHKYVGLK